MDFQLYDRFIVEKSNGSVCTILGLGVKTGRMVIPGWSSRRCTARTLSDSDNQTMQSPIVLEADLNEENRSKKIDRLATRIVVEKQMRGEQRQGLPHQPGKVNKTGIQLSSTDLSTTIHPVSSSVVITCTLHIVTLK